ncbi:MAG TPA: NAD(P)-binding domain-containing protein [Candidatus Bathyarchaeia archaeon]|nr:NAD(P)-binding domain-containing protein [Candidatus Bathyarchaeia archaeon]
MKLGKMKVCVIGLGQVGFPVAQYADAKGLEVWGYDINPSTVENARKAGEFEVTCSWEDVPQVDVYIVCVTTSQRDGSPDLSPVFDVCKKISEKAKPSALVSIESTITPGTCNKIFENIFKSKINLVHAPHRYWASEPVKHGVNQIRVIGAINSESLNAGVKFYKETLGIPMHVVSSVEVAEMCKITENSHRYLQIAFSEELKMICAKIGLNFDELREAMNTKWNVDMPEARDGIGGHCLPKDIRYVTSLAPSQMLESAIDVDKKYREWLTKQK